jgi:site-specific recombinase XerC
VAAKRFFRKLLKGLRYVPRVLVTDKLGSYQVAHRELMSSVEHRRSRYLNNRAENSHQPTRKPSAHTLKAYRQDFDAIAALLAGDTHDLMRLPLAILDTEAMRSAFAEYARTHEAASIRRCWSTWNVLCTFLFTAELIPANPMPMIGRPKQPKSLPKSLPPESVTALLAAVSTEPQRPRSTDWLERDRAIIITGLLAGLRADELLRANIGDLRRTDDGAVLQVRGKGDKDRRIPVEPFLVDVLEHYLDSRKNPIPQHHSPLLPHRGTSRLAGVSAAVRRRRRPAHHPWHPAVPRIARLPAGRHRRHPRQRCSAARPSTHLRHRTGQRRHQRLRPDEPTRPRSDDHLPALYHRRRHRHPRRCGEERAVRDGPQYRMTPTTAESPRRLNDLQVPAHLVEFLAGPEEFVALGELADDLIRRMPPALVRCHVVADSSLPEHRARESHNDWTTTTGSPQTN